MWWTTARSVGRASAAWTQTSWSRSSGNAEVLVPLEPLGLDRVRLGHLDHEVRLADDPALGPLGRRGQIGGVPLGRPLLDPGEHRRPLARGQAAVVGEVPASGTGGRRARGASGGGRRPPGCPAVRRRTSSYEVKRERPDLARPVASTGTCPDDRRHVLAEVDRADLVDQGVLVGRDLVPGGLQLVRGRPDRGRRRRSGG